jgi:hypothetical protein
MADKQASTEGKVYSWSFVLHPALLLAALVLAALVLAALVLAVVSYPRELRSKICGIRQRPCKSSIAREMPKRLHA